MEEIKKIKEVLKGKQIIRIDKTPNEKESSTDFIVIFIIPDKKQPGHIVIRVTDKDKKFLKEFKKILNDSFDISIKGYKNWKKIVKEY